MHKRGQMIPRGDNRWLLRVYLGRTAEGQRKYTSKMIEGTTSQARQELTKMLRDGDTQTLARPSKMTLAEYVEEWFASKASISESTLKGYKLHLRLYILPHLGFLKLHEITTSRVQTTYNALRDTGFSPRTIEYSHTVLHQALKKAIQVGYLVRNPTTDAERPPKVERESTILSPKQMHALFQSERGRPFYAVWLLMLDTGLRPGEVFALKWADLTGDTLHVRRVIAKTLSGGYQILERKAKTKKSLRPVTLSVSAIEALKEHRRSQAEQMLAFGPNYVRNDFIFASRLGSFLFPGNMRDRFKTALKRAGLPTTVRLYDTRHSHATALLNAGVSLTTIADRLGHSSTRVTEAVYAKVMPETRREVAATMEGIFERAAAE